MPSAFLLAFLLSVSVSSPQLSTISGTITDPAARPVAGAEVAAVAGQRVVAMARADADGRFTLALPAGRFELIASAPGFRGEPRRIDATSDRDVTLRLDVAAIADAVVVSAAHVDVPLSRATDSVQIITAGDIDARQAETLIDALRAVSGLGVTASGGRGAVTSVFTRGGESDYTLVLLDGVPLNEFGGSVDLAHLSPAGVDRIEVIRGPQSALHGSGAIAGVIQIVTAHGGPAHGAAQIEAGSGDMLRAALDGRGSPGGWSVGGGIDAIRDEGFNGAPAGGGRVTNDDYRRTEISGALSRRLGTGARVRATARWNGNERGFPGPFGSNPAGNFAGIDTVSRGRNTLGAATAAFDVSRGRLSHRVLATVMRLESEFESPFGESTSSTGRASARYAADWTLADTAGLSAGADVARESGRSRFILNRAGQEIPVERTIAGYFAEARAAAGTRVYATLGARLDQIHRHALPGDASPFGARPDMPSDTVWSLNPRVSAVAYLTPPSGHATTRLRASYATGIRPPSAFELAFTDNPGLEPERNRSSEIALEQTLGGGAVHLSAAAFWNRYQDLIITVQSLPGASRYRSDNLSNARARGVELSGAARGSGRLAWLSLRAGYTWLETEILAADGATVTGLAPFQIGDRLPRRPAHRAFVDAGVSSRRVSAFVTVEARGKTLDVEPSFGLFGGLFENSGYATASAGAAWDITRRLRVFGRLTNLFDRSYEEILGFPAPGRRIAAGVRVAAGR